LYISEIERHFPIVKLGQLLMLISKRLCCSTLLLPVFCNLLALTAFSGSRIYYRKIIQNGKGASIGLLQLKEERAIEESGSGYQLLKPTRIISDKDGNIYVLDYIAAEIKIFDRDGKYVKKAGRSGVGPGELDGANDIFISKNEIGANCGARRIIVYFSITGKYLRTIKLPFLLSQTKADSEGNLYGVIFNGTDEKEPLLQIVRYSPSTGSHSIMASKRWKEPAPFTATLTFAMLKDDQLVVGNSDNGYVVRIFNKMGTLIREIKKEFKLTKIRDEEIKKMMNFGPSPVGIPKYYEPYYRVYTAESGIILVEVHDKITEEGIVQLNVFNEQGEYLGDIKIKRCLDYYWINGKLFTIQDDSEGLPVIKIYSVKWNLPSGQRS
jgi:hypothetical protein